MKSEDIYTVGDLIHFLLQYDPQKRVMVYNEEWGQENPLQYIDVLEGRIVIYD
jgi:hypothetical protein